MSYRSIQSGWMQTHRNRVRDYLYLTNTIERELWRTFPQKETNTRVATVMPHLAVFQRRCLEKLALLERMSAPEAEVLVAGLIDEGERLVKLFLHAYAEEAPSTSAWRVERNLRAR